MTCRERLMAALRCEQPDRVPIHMRGVLAWDENWCASRDDTYRPLIEAVREHCDCLAQWSPPQGFLFSDLPQGAVRTEEIGTDCDGFVLHRTVIETPRGPLTSERHVSTRGLPGLMAKYYICTDEDVRRLLSLPYEPVEPTADGFAEMEAKVGDRGVTTVGIGMNPLGHVYNLLGTETLALWSATKRDTVFELHELIFERMREWLKKVIATGVGPVFATLGHELCTPPMQSPRDFRDFCVRYDKPLFDMIHEAGGLVHVHCHGSLDGVLEMFAEMGTDALHPIEAPPWGDVPLAEAKRRVGHRICLEGNIQMGDLLRGEPGEVEAICRQAVRDGKPGGGFILAPSASPYLPTLDEVTLRNYLTMMRVGLEDGRY
ncbi:MAG: uroporphyrinogen decarboxylase family protein [Armatimonadota bacterium]